MLQTVPEIYLKRQELIIIVQQMEQTEFPKQRYIQSYRVKEN